VSDVDLSALRMQQSDRSLPRRPVGPRLLIAAALALVLAVVATFAWPLLRPVRVVQMAPIRAIAAATGDAAIPIAEAVGWVEPDPFPVIVQSLVEGRIESIEVLEGAVVKAGETVIARLANASLLAARDRAAADLLQREAAMSVAIAQFELAEARLQQRAELRTALVDARQALAAAERAAASLTAATVRLEADVRGARAGLLAQEELHRAGGANAVALERARAGVDAAVAAHESGLAEQRGAMQERDAARTRMALAEELLSAPTDLEGDVSTKRADAEQVRASCDAARTELAIADRELQWATVKAPVDGIVLRLIAEPGDWANREHAGIVALYDPARLRARIDVPLGSVAGIEEGQAVEVRSEVTANVVIRGVVQRIQHESDLLKNTLQVKVGLIDPPPILRPETLCRARFLAAADRPATATQAAFLVPKAAVRGGRVFVFDPSRGTARAVAVTVTGDQGENAIVRGELSITQRLVLGEVEDGEAVREAKEGVR
jgi:multidrug efflux pump subunit AcrA (membrane-fusion protein)